MRVKRSLVRAARAYVYQPSQRPLAVSEEVREAVRTKKPVVALETTIYTHGFPHPENLALAQRLEKICREHGAVPATVGVLDSVARVGMSQRELSALLERPGPRKLSRRDLALATARSDKPVHGGTTIAGTMILAHLAGIKVFATGGLGGVHRHGESSMDVSADLTELGRTPVAVICSGCKGFLDIPRTLEYLETQGVPVATFAEGRSDDVGFPAFWSTESGIKSPASVKDEAEAAAAIYAQNTLQISSGMLFASPVPAAASIPRHELDQIIETAIRNATEASATGSANTPFILKEIKRLSGGRSVEANTALVEANVARGARVAVELSKLETTDNHSTSYQPHYSAEGRRPSHKGFQDNRVEVSSMKSPKDVPDAHAINVVVAGSVAYDISCDYQPKSPTMIAPLEHTSNPARISEAIGGVGYNVWRNVVKTGANSTFCSVIGEDSTGRSLRGTFEQEQRTTIGLKTMEQKHTARYIAVNDARKDLVVAMADMGIMESTADRFDELWLPHIKTLATKSTRGWLVLDANWDSNTLHKWISTAQAHGIATVFEPVSVAKSGRLFEHSLDFELPRVVDVATPNALELNALYESAQEHGLLERPDWWQTIDALGIPSSGARTELIRIVGTELHEQGVPQRSIQILPFIPNLLTTLGSKGVLLTRILLAGDRHLSNPASSQYIVARSKLDGNIGGLYMRLFPAIEELDVGNLKTVNGAGDAFCGTLVGLLAQSSNPMIEEMVDEAQIASLNILRGDIRR